MANILSEPFLGELADRESEIHSQRTTAKPSELVLEVTKEVEADPTNVELWIKLGRAYRRQQMHREAIDCYSQGIAVDPFYGLLYRHRGHAYLNTTRWPEAIADFTTATRLIPDNWDSWYHLGASCFINGQYEKARQAYVRCYELNENLQMLVAVTDWYWMTLKRLGKDEEAAKLLECIPDTISEEDEKGGGKEYHKRLMMYKGKISPEEAWADAGTEDIQIITTGYGIANYYYVNGQEEKGNEIVLKVLQEGKNRYWSAFGYQASLAEAQRRGLKY